MGYNRDIKINNIHNNNNHGNNSNNMMLFRPLFLVTLLVQLAAVSVRVVVATTNSAMMEEQGDSSAATRAVTAFDTTTSGVDVGRRALKKKKKKKNKKGNKSSKSKKKNNSKTKGSKKSRSRTSRPTLAPTPVIPTPVPTPVPTAAPTSAPTMAPTSSASGDTAVFVAAPPGTSQEEIEQELTAQVVATLGLVHGSIMTRTQTNKQNIFNKRRDLRARQLQTSLLFRNGVTTTIIDTVSTVIQCREIFIPPAQKPPNVDECYRLFFTVTIQSSTESSSESQVVVDEYLLAIYFSVDMGVFTEDLRYIVVVEGSTDITGVPTISPSNTPTIAPVVPTTPAPTNEPTNEPTYEPTKAPTKSPTKAPVNSPTTPTVIRWTAYADLTGQQVGGAMALDYTQATWNTLGTNSIEESAWYYLTLDQRSASAQIGIFEEAWDCYQNHYGDYSWSELEEFFLAKYLIALGWNQSSWEGLIDPPNTSDMFWMQLTRVQQEAALEVCYSPGSWDMIPIPDWN